MGYQYFGFIWSRPSETQLCYADNKKTAWAARDAAARPYADNVATVREGCKVGLMKRERQTASRQRLG
jgi:hypothetical protein